MKPTTKMSLLIILLVGMMTVFSSPIAAEGERTIEISLNTTKISNQGYGIPSYGLMEVGKIVKGTETSTFRAIYTGDFQVLTRLEITEATITLPRHMEGYQTGDSSEYTLSVHIIEEPWSEIRPIKWEENMPVINLSNGLVGKWVVNPNRENTDIAEMMPAFDITELLKNGPVHGFVVKLTNESRDGDARSVFSRDFPILKVVTSTPTPPEVPEDLDGNGLYPTDLLEFIEANPKMSIFELGEFELGYIANYTLIHGTPPGIPGDIDADNCVDYEDALEIVYAINNNSPYNPLMDMNDDGFITPNDITTLEKFRTFLSGASSPGPEVADFDRNGIPADSGDWEILRQLYVIGNATEADIALMTYLAFEESHGSKFGDENFRMEVDRVFNLKITYADWMVMKPYIWENANPQPVAVAMERSSRTAAGVVCAESIDIGVNTFSTATLSFSFSK